ncbi:iron ABC transporter permease [Methanomassiliicoccales archaeon LGM-RCC1]|nr:iron ABC transporter permease [Candidatus Methanomethylophilaceae archaeon]WII07130.1 iron ABC transporter permease [Methanomassiliicoccales archaeon LGM-RCC1]
MGKEDYYRSIRRKWFFIILCAVLTVVAIVLSLSIGMYELSFVDCYTILIDHIMGNITDPYSDDIVINTRLPISLFAVIVGAVLALGGAVMQSMLRNPLADPYTMGVSSGALLGASIAIVLGNTIMPFFGEPWVRIVMAFGFSLIPVAVILLFSFRRRVTATKIILIGIAMMYIFSAIVQLLMITASEETLSEIYSWRVGTLALTEWSTIPIPLAISLVCGAIIFYHHRRINVMMAGANSAHSMGVDPRKTILVEITLVSLMTAAVVCFTGTIGFVGLVAPHIARLFVGSETKHLLPASAVFGGLFLLLANCIARVSGEFALPVGVISAIIGCPLFIIILIRMRRKSAWR